MISCRDSFLAGLILTGFCAALAVAEPTEMYFKDVTGNSWRAPSLSEICHHGYAASHRMPYEQSRAIKHRLLAGRDAREYELDHIVPLCLGGSNDLSNLQLQPWPEAHSKDILERKACKMVCSGAIDLDVARGWFKRSH